MINPTHRPHILARRGRPQSQVHARQVHLRIPARKGHPRNQSHARQHPHPCQRTYSTVRMAISISKMGETYSSISSSSRASSSSMSRSRRKSKLLPTLKAPLMNLLKLNFRATRSNSSSLISRPARPSMKPLSRRASLSSPARSRLRTG